MLSVTIGLLALSHNVLHIFSFPLLFIFGVLLSIKYKDLKKIFKLFLSFAFGITLASYYLIPAIIERRFISSYEQINLVDHFPFIKQLIIPSWGYGISTWGPYDGMSFQIGVINLLAVLGAILLIKKIKNKILTAFFLVTFGLSVILMNSRTLPLWQLNKLFHFIQFPWRLLIFTTFSSSLLLGLVTNELLNTFKKKELFIFTGILISIILVNIWYFKPSEFKNVSDEKYLEAYFANRTLIGERGSLSQEYLKFSEDYIPPTLWQKQRPKDIFKEKVFAEKEAVITYQEDGLSYQIEYTSKEDNEVSIATTYFPGWNGYIDGNLTQTFPKSDLGFISFSAPAGYHRVVLIFENTKVRTISNLVSLFSALSLIVLLLFSFKKKINLK